MLLGHQLIFSLRLSLVLIPVLYFPVSPSWAVKSQLAEEILECKWLATSPRLLSTGKSQSSVQSVDLCLCLLRFQISPWALQVSQLSQIQ